jgi:hypothetical protein
MEFTYSNAFNVFIIVWCVITISLLWASWDEVGAKARSAVAFASPVLVYSLGLSSWYLFKDFM